MRKSSIHFDIMIAMILAAGRGQRLRPLTDHCPKPLILAGNKPLIVHTLERLKSAGFDDIIINTAWLGQQIEDTLGDGQAWGVTIRYSHEQEKFGRSLETAGGIRAMMALNDDISMDIPFLAINGDIVCDFDLGQVFDIAARLNPSDHLAHLIVVPNPDHHQNGDFAWQTDCVLLPDDPMAVDMPRFTFSGIGVYHPQLFAQVPLGQPVRLIDVLKPAITEGKITAQCHTGVWIDAGTPERLQKAADYYGEHGS